MLIYCHHSGQLCNRLWSLVPAIAFALKNKSTLHVFFANADYLRNFSEIRGCKFWLSNKRCQIEFLVSLVQKYADDSRRQIVGDLNSQRNKRFKIQSINGWKHCGDYSYVDDYRNDIINMFAFDSLIVEKCESFLKYYEGVTIGVHVRRGDYKKWRDGIYYYYDDTYATVMLSLQKQIKDNYSKKSRFVICSNEPFYYSNDMLDICQMQNVDSISDLCLLSKCDLIVGPPSTYSQWASFVGNVPLNFIIDENSNIELENFSPIVRMNTFCDGRKLIDMPDKKFIVV